MTHFKKRCLQRLGTNFDEDSLRDSIFDGKLDIINIIGNTYEIEFPFKGRKYNMIYDYETDSFVTIYEISHPISSGPTVKRGKKGKHRQTKAKKKIPMICYERIHNAD